MSDDRPAGSDADAAAIRDAACLVVIDRSGTAPRLLLGQRLDTQIFLPGKWVFPGGRVDGDDQTYADQLSPRKPEWRHASGLRKFAVAAIRELFEETGLIAGKPGADTLTVQHGAAPASWQAFLSGGFHPCPEALTPIARAITPPGRVRRYDTWFFEVSRSTLATVAGTGDGELRHLDWFSVADATRLDLPNITRLVLDDVAEGLRNAAGAQPVAVPFYFHDGCGFRRTLIDPECAFATP